MIFMFGHERGHCRRGECPREHHHFPERGWIQFLFLRILYEQPMHGYQLKDDLERRGFVPSGRLESGSVYTILRRMEHRGLVTSEWERDGAGPDKRTYVVTEEGKEILRFGLESILRRKALIDDLAAFYQKNFLGDEGRGHGPEHEESIGGR